MLRKEGKTNARTEKTCVKCSSFPQWAGQGISNQKDRDTTLG
jgi:hypothetical protein